MFMHVVMIAELHKNVLRASPVWAQEQYCAVHDSCVDFGAI